ncbi:hypothetical protein V8F20_009824 [Naviculisporaceae sp. PSN 640]
MPLSDETQEWLYQVLPKLDRVNIQIEKYKNHRIRLLELWHWLKLVLKKCESLQIGENLEDPKLHRLATYLRETRRPLRRRLAMRFRPASREEIHRLINSGFAKLEEKLGLTEAEGDGEVDPASDRDMTPDSDLNQDDGEDDEEEEEDPFGSDGEYDEEIDDEEDYDDSGEEGEYDEEGEKAGDEGSDEQKDEQDVEGDNGEDQETAEAGDDDDDDVDDLMDLMDLDNGEENVSNYSENSVHVSDEEEDEEEVEGDSSEDEEMVEAGDDDDDGDDQMDLYNGEEDDREYSDNSAHVRIRRVTKRR